MTASGRLGMFERRTSGAGGRSIGRKTSERRTTKRGKLLADALSMPGDSKSCPSSKIKFNMLRFGPKCDEEEAAAMRSSERCTLGYFAQAGLPRRAMQVPDLDMCVCECIAMHVCVLTKSFHDQLLD